MHARFDADTVGIRPSQVLCRQCRRRHVALDHLPRGIGRGGDDPNRQLNLSIWLQKPTGNTAAFIDDLFLEEYE